MFSFMRTAHQLKPIHYDIFTTSVNFEIQWLIQTFFECNSNKKNSFIA